ncbi:glycoside hydrolase family 61 protein [Phlebiopsis gigantea 11061_1 CR5-6]|uniref:lytic cellulose monooxygenase (C4-dehydrogenating) n=1 Tax=Phlebiopsis gigantea (strain 11061_1 CR5-6) TaxID=745531 RepID=A0A0C3RYZ8_PHLG1|nr:glycoside hydrolase family 61 protein [Phlebiopsis gigantea 11061_1 CR5-6]
MQSYLALAVLFAFLPFVAAHGYVSAIAIDGQWYAGNQPNNYKGPSPIRLVSDIGPVKGATNPDIICGLSAQNAEMVVNANPGSVFSIQWSGGDGVSKWPHNTGPLMTYMASCGSTPCNEFNATGAKWFKIDQLGLSDPSVPTWYQADISSNGDSFDVTLPQNLAPGGYLVRHEIIALHLADTLGGAEFYPMCTQVMVGGSGNGSPSPTVSFPGAYADDDAGIFDPDVFNPGTDYVFPGGAVANLAGTDASMAAPWAGPTVFPSGTSAPAAASPTASRAGSTGTASTPSASAATGTGAGTGGGGAQCALKAQSAGAAQKRHFKRFARRVMSYASH